MAQVSINRENFVLHKIQSLTGILPVGFYMCQHLTLNSFSIAGPAYFDSVIGFFDGMPWYVLLAIETFFIWIPLLFHSIYGIFITYRAHFNFVGTRYGWEQNRMYTLQRFSGLVLTAFLVFHVATTTGRKYFSHDSTLIKYAAWHENLTSHGYILLIFYMVGILAATYHFSYGIWNFSIRWGLAISEEAQEKVQKFSFGAFIALTVLGWAAILGFVIPHGPTAPVTAMSTPSAILTSTK